MTQLILKPCAKKTSNGQLGRGMGSPIPRLQEGAWTREGPKVGGEDCEDLRVS